MEAIIKTDRPLLAMPMVVTKIEFTDERARKLFTRSDGTVAGA